MNFGDICEASLTGARWLSAQDSLGKREGDVGDGAGIVLRRALCGAVRFEGEQRLLLSGSEGSRCGRQVLGFLRVDAPAPGHEGFQVIAFRLPQGYFAVSPRGTIPLDFLYVIAGP